MYWCVYLRLPSWDKARGRRSRAAGRRRRPRRRRVVRVVAVVAARPFPVRRRHRRSSSARSGRAPPWHATSVRREGKRFTIATTGGGIAAKAVVSATGTWQKPFIPDHPGRELFSGVQIHSANYESPDAFAGKRVLIIGGGNSGAQILAEVSLVADATWVTIEEPNYLPDNVDGRVLFDVASEKYKSLLTGNDGSTKSYDLLGSIVMVEPVRKARDAGRLMSKRPFVRFTKNGVVWEEGKEPEPISAVIWCTGFKSALDHISPLGIIESNGRVKVSGRRSEKEPNLWLVGYGNWTGFASATLVGVGRTARTTAKEIEETLKGK